MNPLKVYKFDRDFVVLNPDQEVPAAGSPGYWKSAEAALKAERAIVDDHIDDGGAKPHEIEIIANEHASAELIRKYGFTAI
ncbi:hypothetical protein ASD64_01355 [Mesorhizobium sp. Root157]|uniref:hypothetical protein n=1 Tax=Mesorhizobium sp. Root157 TaxID=1736477 RepID=UPI0006F77EFD|nr:hypothetical protein [Mesorhizobium sp. Root157]KRA00249.1 hypothetical protein ASD64_01355 [Mesorhizobium sp. Root157]